MVLLDSVRTAKITISLNPDLLQNIDLLVRGRVFASRSQAVQVALQEKMLRMGKTRLARECAKLEPIEEQSLADLGLGSDIDQWPTY